MTSQRGRWYTSRKAMENETKKNDFLLPVSIIVAGVMIAGSIVYLVGSNNPRTSNQAGNEPNQVVDPQAILTIASTDVVLGNANAPLSLVEYGDYQCPWCGKLFSEVEAPLRKEFIETGKVKMVYRDFAFLGPESMDAANAAHCAKEQGKFWLYHDALYEAEHKDGAENNGNLNSEFFMEIAGDLDLNLSNFGACLGAGKYLTEIEKIVNSGRLAGVKGTPALFLNGVQVGGFIDFKTLKAQIASLETKKDL